MRAIKVQRYRVKSEIPQIERETEQIENEDEQLNQEDAGIAEWDAKLPDPDSRPANTRRACDSRPRGLTSLLACFDNLKPAGCWCDDCCAFHLGPFRYRRA